MSEISYQLGFSSPAYFGQVYTEEFGYPPSEERKSPAATVAAPSDPGTGSKSTRKLAAIMFTDIVGYTALMGTNEQKALEILRQNREIQRPLVEGNNGRWLKELGDGVLAQLDVDRLETVTSGHIARSVIIFSWVRGARAAGFLSRRPGGPLL